MQSGPLSEHPPGVASTLRRAYVLEFATIGWNTVEAIVALIFGLRAGSIALTAFGFDSVIEVFSAVVVLFEFRGHSGQDEHRKAERRTLKLIGGGFFLLATYVVISATWDLLHRSRPDHSIPGIVLTSASLATMWLLAAAKH